MLAELYITEMELVEQSGQHTSLGERLDTLGQTVDNYLDDGALILKPDALLKEVTDDILAASLRQAVILDDDGFCLGIITRTDLARIPRRRVILVDHNESSQSIRGIQEAEVVAILDHHRIGDIQSSAPIQFINYPLGSTATIVTLEYQRNHLEPTRAIAGILLSALMTDTVMLKSPTTTPVDRDVASYLGELLGEDPLQFGVELFGRKDSAETLSIEALVGADLKEFELGDARIAVAQHETVNLPGVLAREAEIAEHLAALVEQRGYQFALLLATDVIAEGSQFIVAGNTRVLERAFDLSFANGSVWVPGVLSRKKQVTSRLFEHLA
jgi:manganese-dependent inorganic pyrophosphatase